jgi:hypothetical protein
MSLSTGASLITLSLLLNKVSGLYGLLALLTGYHLSPIQLSMYIYSLFALVLTALLVPHIRTQSPLHCLALAWFYVLDSAINLTYTVLFGITWFLVLAQHNAGETPSSGPGASTIDDTAGFTSPQYNVSKVDIIVDHGQDAVAAATPASAPAGATGNGSMRHALLQPESMNSLGVIISLWTIRLYFCLVMLAYARFVLRQHIAVSGSKISSTSYISASPSANLAENPFSASKPEGQGWKGKLGRAMVAIGRSYWLGSDEDDSWMSGMGRKFRRSEDVLAKVETPGPLERERRRRSGTGPPLPAETLVQSPQKGGLSVPMQNLH